MIQEVRKEMKMKRTILWLTAIALLLSLAACGGSRSGSKTENSGSSPAPQAQTPAPTDPGGDVSEAALWPLAEMPVKLQYDRMWIYGAYAETEDASMIADIVAAVNALKVGEPSDVFVTDYTDILTFTFADGTTLRLEFEEYNWVKNDRERYHVDGLSPLRSLLDNLLEESEKAAAGR